MLDRTFYATTFVAADGVSRTWPFSFAGVKGDQASGTKPYLYDSDVKVQEIFTDNAGVHQVIQRTGVLNMPNQITIDGPPVELGREIRIYRETEIRFPLVDYRDLQSVSEYDLDLANRQAVFIAQESRDAASANLIQDNLGNFDVKGRRLVNVAPGRDEMDAVNVQQLNRTLRGASTDPALPELPPIAERADKLLSFNSRGEPIAAIPNPNTVDDLELRLRSSGGADIVNHREGTVATHLDSATSGLGDYNPDGMLQIHVGDSTTEQAGGSGFMFDFITTYWRAKGMPLEKLMGTINFGGSGYTLKGFLNDPAVPSFTGPTGPFPGVPDIPGKWDYYGHKPAGAVSQATSFAWRAKLPRDIKSVMWVLCYGINDLILYNDIGTKSVEEIAEAIYAMLVRAVRRIQARFPGDLVVLRMPNPMAARPFAAQFPNSIAYPNFDTDKAYAEGLVQNWNAGLRLAYEMAQNELPRTSMYDVYDSTFGTPDVTLPAGQGVNENNTLGDRVHPLGEAYRFIGHGLCNKYFGTPETRMTYNGLRNFADKRITQGWPGVAMDYYGQYLRNNPAYKPLATYNLVGAGDVYMDVAVDAATLKKVLGGFGGGRILYTVGTQERTSVSAELGNFTSLAFSQAGANARITNLKKPPASVSGTRATITFYTDNFLSAPRISWAAPFELNKPAVTAIMDVLPTGLGSILLTTTLPVAGTVTVEVYRHISNTRVKIATAAIPVNGFNITLVSGRDFTPINTLGLLQEVWEIVVTNNTATVPVPHGCCIKATLVPN